ncbi:ANTAR domain-containing response regulator [Georhizobium sp. MAB10]|uniref:ANTAR domain-containing response regulator n=1 Tax=Georhizobium sp. MAB10 TaxID=3028319 RepID=UPI003855AE5C
MTDLINEVRGLNVLVIHPRDGEIEELLKQISRIGCNVANLWQMPNEVPEGTDVIFLEITEAVAEKTVALLGRETINRPTLIGIIGYENPSVLQGLIDLSVHTVIAKPLRPFGVMSNILMARRVWHVNKSYDGEILKLKAKIENVQKIADAKFILMRHHGVNEKEAYKIIRNQAMSKRTSTIEIAQSIINADGILNSLVGER